MLPSWPLTHRPTLVPDGLVGPHSRQLLWAESHQHCSRMSRFMAREILIFRCYDWSYSCKAFSLGIWSLGLSQKSNFVFLSSLTILGYILYSDEIELRKHPIRKETPAYFLSNILNTSTILLGHSHRLGKTQQ